MRRVAGYQQARHRGFTIVECLLAGVILALFTATIATAVGQAGSAARRGKDLRLAAGWLDEVMTRIDLVGPARLLREGPTQGELDERFSWSVKIEEEIIGDLYDVQVTIRWKTGTQTSSVVGFTQFQDPPKARRSSVSWYDL